MENNVIALRIKELRTSQKLTQAEFAESINTTQAALSGYERGDRTPSLDILISISRKYNVSIDWLCGQSENQNPSPTIATYTDLIKLLLLLDETEIIPTKLEKKENEQNYSALGLCSPNAYKLTLDFKDKTLLAFYDEWKEISSIRKSSPSGEKLYAIWLKDIYERYNYKIRNII